LPEGGVAAVKKPEVANATSGFSNLGDINMHPRPDVWHITLGTSTGIG
jgi:hypothetical protein